jgi:phosphatidylglycerol:prolipoprotein diacylglycerol transferase
MSAAFARDGVEAVRPLSGIINGTMIPYPNIDPEIIRLGPFAVRWYGVMYLLGFLSSFLLVRYQIRERGLPVPRDFVESLFSYLILGLLIGARLGYVVFYNPGYYVSNPLEIAAVWKGGMSFHGGLIGSITGGLLFCRKAGSPFWQMADIVIVTAPIGIGLGRLGNFINGELYGKVSSAPWAMVFPDGGPLPRHPSQLYELLLEGFLLFVILWTMRNRPLGPGTLTGLFLVFYGAFRFFAEFFREPDAQLGLILGVLSMGQILSSAMVFAGLGVIYLRQRLPGHAGSA